MYTESKKLTIHKFNEPAIKMNSKRCFPNDSSKAESQLSPGPSLSKTNSHTAQKQLHSSHQVTESGNGPGRSFQTIFKPPQHYITHFCIVCYLDSFVLFQFFADCIPKPVFVCLLLLFFLIKQNILFLIRIYLFIFNFVFHCNLLVETSFFCTYCPTLCLGLSFMQLVTN